MNTLAAHSHFADSRNPRARDGSATLPALDPVEQMLREQHRDSAWLRLLMCAVVSVLLLGIAGSLLG